MTKPKDTNKSATKTLELTKETINDLDAKNDAVDVKGGFRSYGCQL
jgi:hypothetical protein